MSPTADTQSLDRPDGRTLTYADHGDPDGSPVLFCHGTPGSRLGVPDSGAVAATGTRLLTVDRPGYGGPLPGRSELREHRPHDLRLRFPEVRARGLG
ncbi:hypothetical protein NDI56_12745 [Haloarcula sp. S1CR25-12]|uniref:Alpha/beta hydrolase n=1 Tax=Haloarcula saliterrae TaxID=2950534 RepID=A0ABU2FDC6_9EURY|nr:hypothetical protein [Haloarcula sp. S1CR25-12]MDS0260264.1 hypothetical protein [Haloarcula sp. S1CR25-12]